MDPKTQESRELLERVRDGDRDAMGLLLDRYGGRLRRMIRVRMDPRMRARVGEEDVIQEVLLEASQRLPSWLADPSMPFFLWLRFLAFQRLAMLTRKHLGAQARDVRREVRIDAPRAGATSAVLAAGLAGTLTSPTAAAARREQEEHIRACLDGMAETDREILALRHFEQLSNAEAAAELGLDVSAASKRYVRALARLKETLEG